MRPLPELVLLALIASACHAQANYTNPFAGARPPASNGQMCTDPGPVNTWPSGGQGHVSTPGTPGSFPAPGYDPYAKGTQNSVANAALPSAAYPAEPVRPPPYGNEPYYNPGYGSGYSQYPYSPMPDAWSSGLGFPPSTAPAFPFW